MLTPADISNAKFSKAFRGYNPLEVDRILDEVNIGYEKLFEENKELKAAIAGLEEKLAKSKVSEEALEKTMALAEKMADQETSRAMAAGDVIRRTAELEAEQMIKKAEEEVLSIYSEVERLKLFEKQLYAKHKGFLEFQMQLLDGFKEETIEEPKVLENLEKKVASIEPESEITVESEDVLDTDADAEPEKPLFKKEEVKEEPKVQFQSEPQPKPLKNEIFEESSNLNAMADKLQAALQSLEQIYSDTNETKE